MVAGDRNTPNTPSLIIPFSFELIREVAAWVTLKPPRELPKTCGSLEICCLSDYIMRLRLVQLPLQFSQFFDFRCQKVSIDQGGVTIGNIALITGNP